MTTTHVETLSDHAQRHLVAHVPTARAQATAAEVRASLPKGLFAALEAVYVVDPDQRLLGAVRLPDLFQGDPGASMGALVDHTYPRVGPEEDQEHAAAEALAHRAASVAVTDAQGRFLGAIPALSLLEVLRHEHVEDLQRLAGMQGEQMRDRSALEAPPLRRARHRLPWLFVGLLGSMLSAWVVSRFERVLEARLAVAYFVPAIVYLADAIGTQTESIVVRGLSLSRLPLRQLLAGELRTGALIGATLALLAFPAIGLVLGDVRLGFAVAAALLVAGTMATSIGLLLPWLLKSAGSDPAFGSGPVATILQDVLSLLIYLAIATAVLR